MKTKRDAIEDLTGWKNIAAYLGQPVAVVQRWAKSGLPVTRQGRHVHASREDLDRWLGRESGAANCFTSPPTIQICCNTFAVA